MRTRCVNLWNKFAKCLFFSPGWYLVRRHDPHRVLSLHSTRRHGDHAGLRTGEHCLNLAAFSRSMHLTFFPCWLYSEEHFLCVLQVFNKLIRRYKYLEKGFEEEIKKVSFLLPAFLQEHLGPVQFKFLKFLTTVLLYFFLFFSPILSNFGEYNYRAICIWLTAAHRYIKVCFCFPLFAPRQLLLFLKGFTESERNKLAMLTGILLANGNISASILSSLFNENLVKEGTYLSAPLACVVMLSVSVRQRSSRGRNGWIERKWPHQPRRIISYLQTDGGVK